VHEASRSGAPILALSFFQWWAKNTNRPFDVLLLSDGPLRGEFEKLGRTYVADELSGKARVFNRGLAKLLRHSANHWMSKVHQRLSGNDYKVVYGNSIVCLPWILKFKNSPQVRCTCAIHELTWVIERSFARDYVSDNLSKLDLVIAGSKAVATNLVDTFAIDPSAIVISHAFIDTAITLELDKAKLRAKLGLDPSVFVIGAVGTPELRKGTDLVVSLALQLRKKYPYFQFKLIWVGGRADDELVSLFRADVSKSNLSDHVIFVESTPHPNDYINLYDVFILLSREDPFPLVALNAAYLEKPVIAFERSGGIPELLSDGAGCVVPYFDIERFSDVIYSLAQDRELRSTIGSKAKTRVSEDYTVESGSPQLRLFITGEVA
jgi:glycosyltransferase involved in cell wall biosynthesis